MKIDDSLMTIMITLYAHSERKVREKRCIWLGDFFEERVEAPIKEILNHLETRLTVSFWGDLRWSFSSKANWLRELRTFCWIIIRSIAPWMMDVTIPMSSRPYEGYQRRKVKFHTVITDIRVKSSSIVRLFWPGAPQLKEWEWKL